MKNRLMLQSLHIDIGNFQPSTRQIDIWMLSLDGDIGDAAPFLNFLNPEERARADKLKALQRRKQFIIGRVCLKKILAQIINETAPGIDLLCDRLGKPYINEQSQGERICFNLAHSNEQIVIALALGQELGVDIEKINPSRDCKSLSRRFFSDREQAGLNRLENDELYRSFYACWTRKEAFIKAKGSGTAYGPGSFDVSIEANASLSEINLHRAADMNKAWFNISLKCEPGYAAALAVTDATASVRYRTVQLGKL